MCGIHLKPVCDGVDAQDAEFLIVGEIADNGIDVVHYRAGRFRARLLYLVSTFLEECDETVFQLGEAFVVLMEQGIEILSTGVGRE